MVSLAHAGSLTLHTASHNFRQCLTTLRTHVFMTTQSVLTLFNVLIVDKCVKRTSHRTHHPCAPSSSTRIASHTDTLSTKWRCMHSSAIFKAMLPSPELPYLQKMRGCILYQPSSFINVLPKYSISDVRNRIMSNGFTDLDSIRIRSRSTSWILG